MKKTIKTIEAVNLFAIINSAKYSRMEDGDKIKAWKITRALKPVAKRFDEDRNDIIEKMRPTDDFNSQLQRAQEYERLLAEKKPTIDVMTKAEYDEFIPKLKKYNELVDKALREIGEKEVEFDFAPLSEDGFGRLMASNEWTMAQATTLGDFVCE